MKDTLLNCLMAPVVFVVMLVVVIGENLFGHDMTDEEYDRSRLF